MLAQRIFLLILFFLNSLCVFGAHGQDFQKSIVTGGAKGTSIEIGRDIAAASQGCGQKLNVIESAGSLENLIAVVKQPNTQFGIVQSDVLDYLHTYSINDPDLRRSIEGLRVMFPLYNEEVQVLADRSITRLSELSGKKVAIGNLNSGTFLTARLVLDILQVEDVTRLKIDPAEALSKLMSGEIDAMFYVSGVPTKLFTESTIDGSKYHLLDILEPELLATYTPVKIASGTYPFQRDPVNVVAVKAILMTYDYRSGDGAYNRNSCRAVSNLASSILENLGELKQTGHPKWHDIDLAKVPPGWKVSECVKIGMASDYQRKCGQPKKAAANQDELVDVQQPTNLIDTQKTGATVNSLRSDKAIEDYLYKLKGRVPK